MREVLNAAYQLSGDSERKAFIDVDRVLFSDDWTPLRDRIEKALATTGCPEPTWIETAIALGYAEASEVMWARYQRCEPLKPLALSGDIDGARAAMERWKEKHGRNLRDELEISAALGDRERANELAAEIDARPGGPMLLLLSASICACGAEFDLEATPNFSARVRESGVPWPVETHIHYPAKDW